MPACSARLSQMKMFIPARQEDPLGVASKAIMQVINPFIFSCVPCQTRQNKRQGMKAEFPMIAFRGRPFLSPLGEFCCNCSEEFATSAAAPAGSHGNGDSAGYCISSDLKMQIAAGLDWSSFGGGSCDSKVIPSNASQGSAAQFLFQPLVVALRGDNNLFILLSLC